MKKLFFSKKQNRHTWNTKITAFGPIDIKLPDGEIITIEEFLARGYKIRWGNAIILCQGERL